MYSPSIYGYLQFLVELEVVDHGLCVHSSQSDI